VTAPGRPPESGDGEPERGEPTAASPSPTAAAVSELLRSHRRGDPGAFARLVQIVYGDLRRVARRQLARLKPGETLGTTGLVHEAYLKLVDQSRADWQDRGHFLAVSARAMRQVLIDYARGRSRAKRGGGERPLTLDERQLAAAGEAEHLLALEEALERLAAVEPRLLQVVECRYFAGYTEEETATALGVSTRTVERDWLKAKAWLRQAMSGG
jgi:RNA polymerase sigma factor (TIGR02999 family)